MTKPPQPIDEAELDKLADSIIRDLYERHDAFKGSIEPVYGQHIWIGDTCQHCGTHFKGLESDIRLLFKYNATQAVTAVLKRVDEAIPGELANPYRTDKPTHHMTLGMNTAYAQAHQAITNELSKWEKAE